MDTDGTVSEVKVAHTGDPEVGYKFRYIYCKNLQMILNFSDKKLSENKFYWIFLASEILEGEEENSLFNLVNSYSYNY